MMPRTLVVDDDAALRFTLRGILEDQGHVVDEAADGQVALSKIDAGGNYHLVLSDLRMPKLDGLALLDKLRERPNPPRVIVITAHGSERTAVEAMKRGAYDYFRKPFETDELLAVIERAVESVRLNADNERLEAELLLSRSMVFAAPAMKQLALLAQRVASKDVTVLITGESGTGKERLADALVRGSTRAERPFVRFNCAAITPELAEAELFGHSKGAFTGAVKTRAGLFREAHTGTLFLDEVAELDLRTQAKLLRVLQDGELRPVGEDRPVAIDVRIIAATHRNLEQCVRDGSFREDLLYRLKVVQLNLPPLRERPQDIDVLAAHFLREFGQRYGSGPYVLSDEVRARLAAYRWPGNVRELANAIESLVALSPAGELDAQLLPGAGEDAAPAARASLDTRLAAYERGLLVEAIDAADGNRSEAAKLLGIARATLYEKLKKHGI
ncbi:MAG TPA: sigma-54 dependent transcriptional regulator [Polyangiales bacterium]|nr:sigma-54 dependent transcriptional regulator [Polyangiales bacterium]